MIRELGDGVIEAVDGFGTIDVVGDEHSSKLLLELAPWVTQAWCDGSAGRMARRVPKSWHQRPGFDRWMTLEELHHVRAWVAEPSGPGGVIAGIGPLLQLLAPGRYEVVMDELPSLLLAPRELLDPGLAFVGGFTRPKAETVYRRKIPVVKVVHLTGEREWWYCWDEEIELVPTDHWPPPDYDTVRRYRARIRDHARPCVVLLRPIGGGPAYVLDGHHKLAAYLAENIPPTVVDISRLTAPAVDV